MCRFAPLPIRRSLPRVLAVALVAFVAAYTAGTRLADAEPIPTYVYGIGDNNRIWQINPVPGQQSLQVSFSTGLSGFSNAVAFDRAREQLLFLSQANDLYVWNKSLGGAPGAFQQVTTASNLGISSASIFNAAYYQNSFWFFKDATNELVKATLDYTNPNLPTLSGTTSYVTSGPSPSNQNTFGDIAIDENTGKLYAANVNGLFYSINLSDPTNITSYTEILASGTNPSLQLAFNQDYSILYGQVYSTGKWYSINTTSGSLTDLNLTTILPGTTGGFRDLGGASTISTVPEPSTIALAGMGAAGLLWQLARRRSRRG